MSSENTQAPAANDDGGIDISSLPGEGPEPVDDLRPVLLICGADGLAHTLAPLADDCGFAVDVADASQDSLGHEGLARARKRTLLPDDADMVALTGIGRNHHVLIDTEHLDRAIRLLVQALNSPARYIGLTGDRQTRTKVFAALRERGIPAAELAAVCCPAGLPIPTRNMWQKAVAIMAEVLAASGGNLQRLRIED